jgi:hypothetical protein
VINYDGRRFSPVTDQPGERPVAHYHQSGDLMWAEFSGGEIRRGQMVGKSAPDGELHYSYGMVLDNDVIITGFCRAVPEVLDDGRIRLTEHYERFGSGAERGVSILEEVPDA